MRFKKSIIMSTLGLSLTACGGGGSDSGGNSNNSTATDKPTNGDGDVIFVPPTVENKTITVAGSVYAGKDHLYAVSLCSGNICETTVSDPIDGSYEFDVDFSQWPTDQPVTLSANLQSNEAIKLSNNLGNLAEVDNYDVNNDQLIDSDEFSDLLLTPVTMAFNLVAKEVLAADETNRSTRTVITPAELNRAKELIAEQSENSVINITEEQVVLFRDVLDLLNASKESDESKAYPESYKVNLTAEQIASISGKPEGGNIFMLSPDLMKHIYETKKGDKNFDIKLNHQQLSKYRDKLVLNQTFVLELTALALATLPAEKVFDEQGVEIATNPSLPVINTDINNLLEGVISKLKSRTVNSVFDAYTSIAIDKSIVLPAVDDLQKSFQGKISVLENSDYESPLKALLLTLNNEKKLTIKGNFPAVFTNAKVSVLLGVKPTVTEKDSYYNADFPPRIIEAVLLDNNNRRHLKIDVAGKSTYQLTIPLFDDAGSFESCQPGSKDGSSFLTNDNMQDTLTLVVEDPVTGAQVRSVLGSFCEIAQLDNNADGIVDSDEHAPLNAGYMSTAQAVLLLKTNLVSYGSMYELTPLTLLELKEQSAALPREATEFLAGLTALQAQGHLFGQDVDLIEGVDFHQTLLSTIGINMKAKYGMISNNNQVPELLKLYEKLSENSGLGAVMRENHDKNVSHVVQASIDLINDSQVDNPFFTDNNQAGNWLTVYPNSHLSPVCMKEVLNDQVIGLGLLGQGIDEQGMHWVTVGWSAQSKANSYTVAWATEAFNNINSASASIDISETQATITGLTKWQAYQIRVQSDSGSISAPLSYKPGQKFVADTRVTSGTGDATRGRDVNSNCDPLSGLATNSDRDGIKGARYLKLDNSGAPISRQDLSHKLLEFSCVSDLNSGLVWETKKKVTEEHPFSLHDDQSYFAQQPFNISEPVSPFNGSCYNPETDEFSSDAQVCHSENQVKWVNESQLCGLTNWRLPTMEELYSLVDHRVENKINWDTRYFPFDSGLDYTYSIKWVDINGTDKYESYYYGFWASDTATHQRYSQTPASDANPHPADHYPKMRKLRPTRQPIGDAYEIWKPGSVMLVSDGFKATTEVIAGSAQ
ncbi:Lcl domain-containing protein [Psychromonas sp. Urea-02u-13]|uniref:Lcl domain-containing protein n=1 Tax=Psychromonas sp. Urea-02u-13 TaxID=2058326 RepID=UPI000C32EDFC|nr:DUF1566 domain-containing protein [Psychromonas sp. Urea-02u-13]PKG40157.1 hypothetical protein CXF74_04915 [Psychromonas sp. Urea-02u-13]